MARDGQGWGRWAVRVLASARRVLVIAFSAVGWWLSTRVLDANGFADVVANSSQRNEVRDYIADQATLRLARTSNFVSAARPIVADAVSQAIATPPVEEAVRDFAVRAHDQIFRFTEEQRVSVSSAQAAITVRTALESINPSLAKKVPPERPERHDDDLAVAQRRHARRCEPVGRGPLHPGVPDRASRSWRS